MENPEGFYTMKGYQLQEEEELTTAMEDYLEMISRLAGQGKRVKGTDLSKYLHVKPSSVTKMVERLDAAGYLKAQRYGEIFLTEKGERTGQYLLYRHDVLNRFLSRLNHTQDELKQVEKIEHFLDRRTVGNLESLAEMLKKAEEAKEMTGASAPAREERL